jgi:transcriptional regulator with XRE-family HTH domain
MRRAVSSDDLQKRRWTLFLTQYARDHGQGWQSALAARIHSSPSTINKQASGKRGPSRKTVQLAIETLGIAADFFSAPWLENPDYRDFIGGKKPKAAPIEPSDSIHWHRFVALGGPDRFGLTEEELRWVHIAPFRGGAQSVDDYIAAAETIVRQRMPEPPGMAEARRKREGRG